MGLAFPFILPTSVPVLSPRSEDGAMSGVGVPQVTARSLQ